MNGLQGLRLGLRSLLRRDQVERELDDELRFHLEMETSLHVRRGLSPAAAQRGSGNSTGRRFSWFRPLSIAR